MKMIKFLVKFRRYRIVKEILALYCFEIPKEVQIGENFQIIHRGFGTVIHPRTIINNNVTIYHNVTIGRADAHLPSTETKMDYIIIDDGVVLFPGSVILGGPGITRIGKGTIIAANAVVTRSTGDNEIWAGVPAKKISDRPSTRT